MWGVTASSVRDSQWRHGWLSSVEHRLVTWGWVWGTRAKPPCRVGGSAGGDTELLVLSLLFFFPVSPPAPLCVSGQKSGPPSCNLAYICQVFFQGPKSSKAWKGWVCLWIHPGHWTQAEGASRVREGKVSLPQTHLSFRGNWLVPGKVGVSVFFGCWALSPSI